MKITSDTHLENFEFWGGAKDLADKLSSKELGSIEGILEKQYPEGMEETELNAFFAYEGDTIADWLGYRSKEDILKKDDIRYLLEQVKNCLLEIMNDIFSDLCLADVKDYMETADLNSDKKFLDFFSIAEYLRIEGLIEDIKESGNKEGGFIHHLACTSLLNNVVELIKESDHSVADWDMISKICDDYLSENYVREDVERE